MLGKSRTPDRIPTTQIVHASRLEVWKGHLPSPDALERYEKTLPGIADRLMGLAEAQQKAEEARMRQNHLHDMEVLEIADKDNGRAHVDIRLGQVLATVITLFAFACAIIALRSGSPWMGAAFIGMMLPGIVQAVTAKPDKHESDAKQPHGN